jgi:hypothetical protein
MIAGEARNSLKLGSTSPLLSQEHKPLIVDNTSREAEENCKAYVEGLWE